MIRQNWQLKEKTFYRCPTYDSWIELMKIAIKENFLVFPINKPSHRYNAYEPLELSWVTNTYKEDTIYFIEELYPRPTDNYTFDTENGTLHESTLVVRVKAESLRADRDKIDEKVRALVKKQGYNYLDMSDKDDVKTLFVGSFPQEYTKEELLCYNVKVVD